MSTSPNFRGIALVAIAACLWGVWPLWIHLTGLTGPIIGLMVLLAMALPAPFVFRRSDLALNKETLALYLGVGVTDGLNSGLYFEAIDRGPVAVAALTHYLAPMGVALLSPLVFKGTPSKRALIASVPMLGGLGLVLWQEGTVFPAITATLGFTSAVLYMVMILATKVAIRRYTALQVVSLHSVVAVTVMVLWRGRELIPTGSWTPVLLFIPCALLSALLAGYLFNLGMARVSAALGGVLTYLEPLLATVVGAFILGQGLDLRGWIGLAVVLGCGAWAAMEPAAPELAATPAPALITQPS
jgi:drug/metabolite transporter (DMT)-like permease